MSFGRFLSYFCLLMLLCGMVCARWLPATLGDDSAVPATATVTEEVCTPPAAGFAHQWTEAKLRHI